MGWGGGGLSRFGAARVGGPEFAFCAAELVAGPEGQSQRRGTDCTDETWRLRRQKFPRNETPRCGVAKQRRRNAARVQVAGGQLLELREMAPLE